MENDMIRISQIKLTPDANKEALTKAAAKLCHVQMTDISLVIRKKSLDCRKNHPVKYVYTVDVTFRNPQLEEKVWKKNKNANITKINPVIYETVLEHKRTYEHRPVVVGSGPAGLFCTYLLALNGYQPLLLERGEDVEARTKQVNAYWEGETSLHPDSSVQFGEGGAGTFSDGKLNTLIKDKTGRQQFVLDTFVSCGAPEDIAYLAKPHIGTDYLKVVVKRLREKIMSLGGEVCFQSKVTEVLLDEKKQKITGVVVNDNKTIQADCVVFAIGHSARDTFQMLYEKGFQMQQKPFAIGVRIEHPREMIDQAQYGEAKEQYTLPTAAYKLTYHASNGRSVYTFCMCPGGYVVNASSQEDGIVVNGMSNYDRMAQNSNAAVVVAVSPDDFPGEHPLAGVEFQRKWEQKAYQMGAGKIPVQTFGDFKNNQKTTKLGEVLPCQKGAHVLANVRECLPGDVSSAIIEGVLAWNQKIAGFAREDAIVSGVETRTSSPVKIVRTEEFLSNIEGAYPCGEGAGYAGGIMSAAMDGLKVAEAIMQIKK